jgi:hypothetical protein
MKLKKAREETGHDKKQSRTRKEGRWKKKKKQREQDTDGSRDDLVDTRRGKRVERQ